MSNPYEDEGDVSPEDANSNLLSEMRKSIEDGGVSPEKDEDDDDIIMAGEPVEDDSIEDGGPATRQQRRNQRRDDWKEEQSARSDENLILRKELAEVRAHINAMSQASLQEQSRDRRDPFAEERAKETDAQEATLQEYQNLSHRAAAEKRDITPEERRVFVDRNAAHSRNHNRIDYREMHAETNSPELQARARLVAQFPDVMDGGPAEQRVKALYALAKSRKEITKDNEWEQTMRLMDQTRKELKLPGYHRPPPAGEKEHSSYGNLRSAGGRPPAKGEIRFPKGSPQRDMAIAMFHHMPEWNDKQKLQAFVNMGDD